MCRSSENICQIRLDFLTFNIAQPRRVTSTFDSDVTVDSATQCQSAQFKVSGGHTEAPVICGLNTGQHSKSWQSSATAWKNRKSDNACLSFQCTSAPWRLAIP